MQDAVAHKGEDFAHHSTWHDMQPGQEAYGKATEVTEGAIMVTEIMSGDYSHVTNNMSMDVDGMTDSQFGQFIQELLKGMDEKKVKKVNIKNNPQ